MFKEESSLYIHLEQFSKECLTFTTTTKSYEPLGLSKIYEIVLHSYPTAPDLQVTLPDNHYADLEMGDACNDCIGICALCNDHQCFDKDSYQQD